MFRVVTKRQANLYLMCRYEIKNDYAKFTPDPDFAFRLRRLS